MGLLVEPRSYSNGTSFWHRSSVCRIPSEREKLCARSSGFVSPCARCHETRVARRRNSLCSRCWRLLTLWPGRRHVCCHIPRPQPVRCLCLSQMRDEVSHTFSFSFSGFALPPHIDDMVPSLYFSDRSSFLSVCLSWASTSVACRTGQGPSL